MALRKSHRPNGIAALGAGFIAMLVGCATGDSVTPGKALPGVIVATNGPVVLLSWDPASPLGNQLVNRTLVELVASYPGVTGETLASATVQYNATSLQFTLPDRLKRAPSGEVCLRFRYARARSVPIRVPDAGHSSDGFRHLDWERNVGTQTRIGALNDELSGLDASIRKGETSAQNFQTWRAGEGVRNVAGCEALGGDIKPPPRPAGAISGADQIPAAHAYCVRQFGYFVRSLKSLRPDTTAADLAAEMTVAFRSERDRLAAAGQGVLVSTMDARMEEANRFSRAIASNPNANTREYSPPIPDQGFALTSMAETAIANAGGRMTVTTGAEILDTYRGCISETRGQFDLAYQSWQAESDPRLLAAQVEPRRAACRRQFVDEGERISQLTAVMTRRAEVTQQLQSLVRPAPLAVRSTSSLVGNACDG